MAVDELTTRSEQVRIDPHLNRKLDQFFSTLKLRLLNEAARRATSRIGDDGTAKLEAEDIVAVAQGVLATVPDELTDAVSAGASNHVRRAS